MGLEVLLAEGKKTLNRPDPVGQHGETEQSVFLRPDADQEGHIPTNSVHPGVTMFHTQPVADGPAGPDRARRPVGHDEMYIVHDEDRPMAGGPVGRFPYSDPLQTSEMSSFNERCQLLATGSMDANEMYTVDDSCRPMTGGPLGRLFSLDPRGPSGVSTLSDENQSPSVDFTAKPWTTERLDDRTGEADYESTTQTRSESESATGVRDPVIQKDSGFQTVRVNASPDNGLTNSRDVSRSSDSGVHSWTEQWENMSENSMDSSVYDTVDSRRNDSGEMSHLLFSAPPNTEDEGDSDYPDTDGSLTERLGGYPSEGMYGIDDEITYSVVTGSDSDRISDIAALSDFLDDSSILGVRKVLRCRVPYPKKPILPTKGCAPVLRTPPVKARSRAEELLFEEGSTRSVWSRWAYGALPDWTDEWFVPCVRELTRQRLARDADPRLDRYYPKLVQNLARAGRVIMEMWYDRDNHRLRRDLMLSLFDEEMEKMDLVSARFPDRHVRKFVTRPAAKPLWNEVPGTSTPPIRRRRGRKYASLRKYETDVEDYFACREEETYWINRATSWYQPC